MRYQIAKVKQVGKEILIRAGLCSEDAENAMDCLLAADMRGVHSHGVMHIKDICARIEAGTIRKKPAIKVEQTAPSAAIIDADHCVGMTSGLLAIQKAVELAETTGIAMVTIKNDNTYGMGAFYPMYAAERNMIGIAVCNTKGYVAPYGGADPVLGTNPISIAIPAGTYGTIVVDMATSQVAVNKIALARKEGRQIPETWAVGPQGERTTDPAVADQGALLPFGGHKGFALQLCISVLAHALAGGAMDVENPRAWAEAEAECNFGCLLCAIDIRKFVDVETFQERAEALLKLVKEGKLSDGTAEILLPGERAAREYQRSEEQGVELPDEVVIDLRELSRQYGVACSL